jgi:hypothetical protein
MNGCPFASEKLYTVCASADVDKKVPDASTIADAIVDFIALYPLQITD